MDQSTEHLYRTPDLSGPTESAADREARIRKEAAMLAASKAHFERFGGVDMEEVDAWLDALDKDPNAPRPSPKKRPSVRR